jgi:LAS superfamily LD-carboxypeptidase LdcB
MRGSMRALAVALLLGPVLLAVPAADPLPASGVGPLPACRLDDILTKPRGYDDWSITQVDWILSLGPKYRPPDLVSISKAGVSAPRGGLIRKVAIDDLKALTAAAEANGTPVDVWSPYRSYTEQVAVFRNYAGWNERDQVFTNFEEAVTFSARPGHSEHQTGVAIDFVSRGETSLPHEWETVPTGQWMAAHAWEYGWLMSYPQGKDSLVCYSYEPWHYRYVGRELAAKIHDSGLTVREYLWANYTQVDPACVGLPPPQLETPGKARSCAFTDASQSPALPASPAASAPPVSASPGPTLASPSATETPTPTGVLIDGDNGVSPGMELALGGLAVLLVVGGVLWVANQRRLPRSRGGPRGR